MSEGAEKSKTVVDEDWKAKIQAEKETARRSTEALPNSTSSVAHDSSVGSTVQNPPDLADLPLPPASLTFLCTTIATQAMIALGQVPNPITGKVDVRLKQAKHYVDTLGMLEEKTKGNRTVEESALLDDLLHQLRMAYVVMQEQKSDLSPT
ncbi:MAG TPA: DUF1844 domain-containing protein [Pirellulales bacterium]|jgi:hypothetical protein